ncbi:MAG: hypothetical protein EOO38_10295, partial [Cytophagaceae bacterium]
MTDRFKQFVLEQKKQAVSDAAELTPEQDKERWLENLRKLAKMVEGWLAEYAKDGDIRVNTEEISFETENVRWQTYLSEQSYRAYSYENVIREVLERLRSVTLIENEEAVFEFIEEYFEIYKQDWNVPRWLADLMVKLFSLNSNDQLIEFF